MKRWIVVPMMLALAWVPQSAGAARPSKLGAPSVAPPDALTRALGRLGPDRYALERASSVFDLAGARARFGDVARIDPHGATLALRDLAARRNRLGGKDRQRADRILARPSDGAADPQGDGYTVTSESLCGTNVCIHWVESTADAPDLTDANANGTPDWVESSSSVLEEVYTAEVTQMGYRAPKSDATSTNRGPDGRLDVYLVDIGDQGIFGYCTTDDPNVDVLGTDAYPFYDVSSYCVLDDDFTPDQFPTTSGLAALQVTAAHEFFHAVQFAYDFLEDRWMLEGTASWMEDEVYDDVDDNYQYLGNSQITDATFPLDFTAGSFNAYHYGSWIWWRFVSEYFGDVTAPDPTVIRDAWEQADGAAGGPDDFSLDAIAGAIAERSTSLAAAYADFGALNYYPGAFYEEGQSYGPGPLPETVLRPSESRPKRSGSAALDHLTHRYVAFRPPSGVPSDASLRVTVDMPATSRGSRATLLVARSSGRLDLVRISLDSSGDGTKKVAFGRGKVDEVTLVLTNASIRYICFIGTDLSCGGLPRDDNQSATFSGKLIT